MKKSDLKELIKPVVKECIQEVLLEEGMLSNIVSEVAKGMQGNLVVETPRPQQAAPEERAQMRHKTQQTNQKLKEHRKKLMDSIGAEAYGGVDLFENVEPMTGYEASEAKPGTVDLGDPRDAGVDISALLGGASTVWKAMK